MNDDFELLSDFVRKTMKAKGLTTRDVERGSKNNITHSYINKIKNGHVKNPSANILQALATGLSESPEILFALARGKSPDGQMLANAIFSEIAKDYADLTEDERKIIEPSLIAIRQTIEILKSQR